MISFFFFLNELHCVQIMSPPTPATTTSRSADARAELSLWLLICQDNYINAWLLIIKAVLLFDVRPAPFHPVTLSMCRCSTQYR